MRDLVNSTAFLLRRKFDIALNRLFPNSWAPLYGMITFSKLPVRECLRRKERQDRIVSYGLLGTKLALGGALLYAAFRWAYHKDVIYGDWYRYKLEGLCVQNPFKPGNYYGRHF